MSAPAGNVSANYPEKYLAADVAYLRGIWPRELGQSPADPALPPALVALSGLPGTGKSHFARQLVQRLPFLILSSDRIRKALVPQPLYDGWEHARVFAAVYRLMANSLAQGRRIVFDATNLNAKAREPLIPIVDHHAAGMLLVGFTAPQALIRRRLAERSAGRNPEDLSDADWPVYRRLLPDAEVIREPHLLVDSAQNTGPAIEEVLRFVASVEGR